MKKENCKKQVCKAYCYATGPAIYPDVTLIHITDKKPKKEIKK